MPVTDDDREKPAGLDRTTINLIVGLVVVALLGALVWLAHELTHASAVMDCAMRGIRNCS